LKKKEFRCSSKRDCSCGLEKICRPKAQGGLGVLDLNIQNKALLLKNLHKFYNKQDIPWVNLIWNSYYTNGAIPGNQMEGSFWWKSHLKMIDLYKAMSKCNLGDGCYWLMAPEKRLLAWSSKSLCVVNDQPVGNPKRKV
jgi:hypothetical protein